MARHNCREIAWELELKLELKLELAAWEASYQCPGLGPGPDLSIVLCTVAFALHKGIEFNLVFCLHSKQKT